VIAGFNSFLTECDIADFNKKNRKEKTFISWDHFDKLCRELAHKVEEEFKPGLIVAVSRGGLVPALIISRTIKNGGVKEEVAQKGREFHNKPQITQKLDKCVKNKRIIVVDEVTDSGRTAFEVKKYLDFLKPKEARFLTVHWKPWSKFKPDFFAEKATGGLCTPGLTKASRHRNKSPFSHYLLLDDELTIKANYSN